MIDSRVAHRYAHALFMVAKSTNTVDTVSAEVSQLRAFNEKNRQFAAFLEAPQVLTEHKTDLLKTLFATRVSKPVMSFLLLLIEKHRIEFLAEISREFAELVEDYEGLIKARIITAVPVDDDFKRQLKEKLEKVSGKKIELVHSIDKDIIGGIIVHLNYKIIDYSVRHQLDVLRHDLLSLKVF